MSFDSRDFHPCWVNEKILDIAEDISLGQFLWFLLRLNREHFIYVSSDIVMEKTDKTENMLQAYPFVFLYVANIAYNSTGTCTCVLDLQLFLRKTFIFIRNMLFIRIEQLKRICREIGKTCKTLVHQVHQMNHQVH